jgi:ABC-type lipoprotein export system ATPase subunit/ABC-type lipoprotein release transport system permease subunit
VFSFPFLPENGIVIAKGKRRRRMLQIKHIRKEYRTKDLKQTALDDVSISFRDNEFVAVLGPSGSGKTTLLNVIGGLDRYDEGDLIINGLSTRKYRDSDWDYYRAHTIGFVFQSYNLIPHQSVLANVELAMTIAGVSRKERRERAVKALQDVGLGDQLHKKPSQMSGGQMQRVAIARALVNDPDIVLADEPTGALDSVTSLQVMELLKEVARDRLVIMVTHNPDLAEKYATRTVRIKDGKIIDDTNPFTLKEEGQAIVKKAGKSSMSFLTALSLSFNNLRTKKARTALVSIAGSIGIIGIALVMALSNGATVYINDMERQAMGSYPLQISSVGYDLSSMMSSAEENYQSNTQNSDDEDAIGVSETLTSAMSTMSENDLASLKEYIESGESDIEDYTADIEYLYDASPQIYLQQDGTAYQVSPTTTGSSNTLFTTSTNSSDFYQLPRNDSLYKDDYTLKAGRWPENENEAVLVLTSEGTVTDTLLYEMGVKPYSEYEALSEAIAEGSSYTIDEDTSVYHADDFLGRSYKVLSASSYYVEDETYHIYTDKSDNADFLNSLLEDEGIELTITGIVQPNEDLEAGTLSSGIGYTYELTEEVMNIAAESDVVKAQQADPSINVLTGKAFSDTSASLDLSSLISVDEEALSEAFNFSDVTLDTSAFSRIGTDIDLSSLLDASSLQSALPTLSESDIQTILNSVQVDVSAADLNTLFQNLLTGWQNSAGDTLTSYQNGLKAYLSSEEASTILSDHLKGLFNEDTISSDSLQQIIMTVLEDYPSYQEEHSDEDLMTSLSGYLTSETGQTHLREAASSLSGSLADLFDETELSSLLSDLSAGYDTYAAAHQNATTADVVQSFNDYLSSEETSALITSSLEQMVDLSSLSSSLSSVLQNSVSGYTDAVMNQLSSALSTIMNQYTQAISTAMADTIAEMSDSFSVDTDALANAFSINMDESDLEDLLSSMMSQGSSDYASNLNAFGYADEDNPSEIDLYPKDFDSRAKICDILDSYNQQVQDAGEKDKTIVYTDLVATMLASVTDIIHTISYILIAFVGISLVVSSIMIGVITYISVLERRKEIGILRALGASKHNIAQVFNAETFITGLLSGLIGVAAAILLCIPLSTLIHHLAGTDQINMSLPIANAGGLILLSILLTVLAGIIPSHKAAKSDPVAALRTE